MEEVHGSSPPGPTISRLDLILPPMISYLVALLQELLDVSDHESFSAV